MNREALIHANQLQYGEMYQRFNWVTVEQARWAMEQRAELERELSGYGAWWGYNKTKIDCRELSPGCRCCGEGTWSCIFVNGLCNTRCFYCPTSQNELGQPTTNTVEFPRVRDYIEYLDYFGFKGVGLSGGEPLLTPDRLFTYLTELKKHFGDRIHTWLYTNGTKVSEPILHRLNDAGLDEIRFDICAAGYDLDKVRWAAKIIKRVTVEIPAIPGDEALLKQKIPEMKEAGVGHLNLHQLRCTPFNCRELLKHRYTFLHGPKVTVLESELTALRLLKYTLKKKIHLPINYCSFIYKNQYQGVAARRHYAPEIKKSYEALTASGLIRTLWVKGDTPGLAQLAEALKRDGVDPDLWASDPHDKRIYLDPALYRYLGGEKLSLGVSYHTAAIRSAFSYMNPFKEIQLKSGKKIFIERQPASPEMEIAAKEEIEAFKKLFLAGSAEAVSPTEELRLKSVMADKEELWQYERMPTGLMEYF
jgi:pyruvate formate-lyase activating enzyme-like uncharacterized protein